MPTYLFVTNPKYNPERVAGRKVILWSCSSKARIDDTALVYVTGVGIQFEWQVLTDAKSHKKWKYACKVRHIRTFTPPISIRDIQKSLTKKDWAPPHQNFRGLSSIRIPDGVVPRILALREIGLPEEVSPNSRLIEGAGRQITVNAYERNAEARQRCLDYYGTACQICGFDFGKVYGPSAEGHIHVHHLTPLGELREEYEVDPVADLRPVCPNCHAVIHLGGELRSIETVKNLLLAGKRRTKR